MSAAFFPQIEGGDGSAATAVDGKALSRSIELLDELATELGVTPLSRFVSVHTDDFGIFEDASLPVPPPKWFSAKEGQKTVAALRAACRAKGTAERGLMEDLEALERVLIQADVQNRGWSLGVDI